MLVDPANREAIREGYPRASVTRRNSGYALDLLLDACIFDPTSEKPFNMCKLIAGFEGTLFFGLKFEFHCDPLPPPAAVMCAHFHSVDEALSQKACCDASALSRKRTSRSFTRWFPRNAR